jgi:hypothetical protein
MAMREGAMSGLNEILLKNFYLEYNVVYYQTRFSVQGIRALLGYYTACSENCLPTFGENRSYFQGFRNPILLKFLDP